MKQIKTATFLTLFLFTVAATFAGSAAADRNHHNDWDRHHGKHYDSPKHHYHKAPAHKHKHPKVIVSPHYRERVIVRPRIVRPYYQPHYQPHRPIYYGSSFSIIVNTL